MTFVMPNTRRSSLPDGDERPYAGIGDEMRLVQLTPPGSGCSIHLSSRILNMPPGVLEGLQLVVSDIEAARAELVERGVEAGPVQHMDDGVWVEGRGGDWTPSSSSVIRTATAGSCRSAPLANS
jgi:hypothetical protein